MIARIKTNLRSCWKNLLATDLLFKLLAYVVFFPATGLLFRLFLWLSGRSVLADTDIARFLVSPLGLGFLILVGGTTAAIYAVEHAVLLSICLASDKQLPAPATAALRFVIPRFGGVVQLTSIVIGRLLLVVLPFLAVGGIVYVWLLTDKDINFYLQAKPTEFWIAAVLIAALLTIAAVIALRKLLHWALAVPILLFERQSPRSSLASSRSRLHERRVGITKGLAIWIAVHALIDWIASVLVIGMAYWMAPFVVQSFAAFLVLMAVLVLSVFLINYAVQLFASATLASWLALLYRDLSEETAWQLPPRHWVDRIFDSNWHLGRVLAGVVIMALLATTVGLGAIETVRWDDPVEIVAHRGGAALGPENTLAAIERSIAAGADWVEIDVQESSDGVVVVVHDSDLAKVAGNPVKIWEATAATLREIDIGSHFDAGDADQRVPTLDEVLSLCNGRVGVNIELKEYGHNQDLERKVVDQVERANMQTGVVVMSLKLANVRKIKQLRPGWQAGLLTAVAMGDLTRVGVDFLAVNQPLATRDLVRRAHALDQWIAAWTVNQPYEALELADRGVDQIITDDPEMVKNVLRWRADRSPLERLAIELAHFLNVRPKVIYGEIDAMKPESSTPDGDGATAMVTPKVRNLHR